jgi:hypothetical protein
MGALLAPYATVTTSVNIDGATAVQSLTTTAELHNPPFIVPTCTSTTVATTTAAQSNINFFIQFSVRNGIDKLDLNRLFIKT